MGLRTSVYLNSELAAMWKASGLPLKEVIRRGLAAGGPVDDLTLESTLRRVMPELLSGLSVAADRTSSGYSAYDGYEAEPYLQDP